jgi:hypothetical protein
LVLGAPRTPKLNRETAEDMAIKGLGFLAADDERLSRFLALSGLDPSHLRAAAASPGFLAGVMAHLASDEALLMRFAADIGAAPEEVGAACALLAGPEFD